VYLLCAVVLLVVHIPDDDQKEPKHVAIHVHTVVVTEHSD
jgi:hypothetical protein